jgi:sortase (surface protein transpeptidase)
MHRGGEKPAKEGLFYGRGKELRTAGLALLAFLGTGVAVESAAPFSNRPSLEAAAPKHKSEPVSTTAELPTTTTTEPQPRIREMQPGMRIGEMSVEISGLGARQPVVTHELITDLRAPEEIEAGTPVDVERSNLVLERGFMVHRDSYIPGWNENAALPTDITQKAPTVIGGHRAKQIQQSPYGSLVLRDIDKVQVGDKLTMNLDDGTRVDYQAVGAQSVGSADIEAQTAFFHATSTKETLILYACDTSSPLGVPEAGTYNPDMRYFVFYERVQ